MSVTEHSHHFSLRTHWKLVVALIAAVCTILALIRYYRLLKQLFCNPSSSISYRTQSRRLTRSRHLSDNALEDHASQFYSDALEPSIIHSLAVSQFQKNTAESTQKEAECAVCLGEFEDGEWLKHLPNCTHVFHSACIDKWFQSHSSCPLCRSDVYVHLPDHECYVSIDSLLETLRREDFSHEREAHYQVLRSEALNLTIAPTGIDATRSS